LVGTYNAVISNKFLKSIESFIYNLQQDIYGEKYPLEAPKMSEIGKICRKIAENDFWALGKLGGEHTGFKSEIHGIHRGEGELNYHLESLAWEAGLKGSTSKEKSYLKEL